MAFPEGVTVVSAEAIAEAKAKEHEKKQQASDAKREKEGLPPLLLEPKSEKVLKVRKLRMRLGVEPRPGETPKECKRRQERTLRDWAGACRFTYNKALLSTRADPKNKNHIRMPFNDALLRQRFTEFKANDKNDKLAKDCEKHGFKAG